MIGSGGAPMEPFRWRRALFLGLISYAASLAGLVFDTFVPVLLQAGHPLWHNTPFDQLIERLCAYLDLAVAQDDIRLFVTCRNKLVHEGRFYCRAATSEEREQC